MVVLTALLMVARRVAYLDVWMVGLMAGETGLNSVAIMAALWALWTVVRWVYESAS